MQRITNKLSIKQFHQQIKIFRSIKEFVKNRQHRKHTTCNQPANSV